MHRDSSRSSCASFCSTSRSEFALEEDLSAWPSLMLEFEPVSNSVIDTKRRELDVALSNDCSSNSVIVLNFEHNVIINRSNVELESLVPDRIFASVDMHLGLVLHAKVFKSDVWVLLAECLDITGQVALNDSQ